MCLRPLCKAGPRGGRRQGWATHRHCLCLPLFAGTRVWGMEGKGLKGEQWLSSAEGEK